MQAMDIMTSPVITVATDTPVREVARLLLERRISAVPVVDGSGKIVGIVSEGDLMRRVEAGTERRRSWWLSLFADAAREAHDFRKAHGMKASDVMTSGVVTVAEDAALGDIVDILEGRKFKRVPVARDGKPVGIVSRANLLNALAVRRETMSAIPPRSDRTLRTEILARLAREPWARIYATNVIVESGTVHLWGVVESEEERKALRVAVEEVPGVRTVMEHLAVIARPYGET